MQPLAQLAYLHCGNIGYCLAVYLEIGRFLVQSASFTFRTYDLLVDVADNSRECHHLRRSAFTHSEKFI